MVAKSQRYETVVRRYRWRMGWAGGVVRASAGLEAARAPSGGGSRHVLERRRSIGDQSLPRAHRVYVGVSRATCRGPAFVRIV